MRARNPGLLGWDRTERWAEVSTGVLTERQSAHSLCEAGITNGFFMLLNGAADSDMHKLRADPGCKHAGLTWGQGRPRGQRGVAGCRALLLQLDAAHVGRRPVQQGSQALVLVHTAGAATSVHTCTLW